MSNKIQSIKETVEKHNANLLVVSKKRSNNHILKVYNMGFRDMGENRVQDLLDKKDELPSDINWHIIGSLQRNKVKYIADFIYKIHSVDSIKLAKEINKHAENNNRKIPILLQFLVAEEDSKQGILPSQKDTFINQLIDEKLTHIEICGIMGMASFTDDKEQVRKEFKALKSIFDSIKSKYGEKLTSFNELSMGMSGDYEIALEEGSTIVRLGSILFNNLTV